MGHLSRTLGQFQRTIFLVLLAEPGGIDWRCPSRQPRLDTCVRISSVKIDMQSWSITATIRTGTYLADKVISVGLIPINGPFARFCGRAIFALWLRPAHRSPAVCLRARKASRRLRPFPHRVAWLARHRKCAPPDTQACGRRAPIPRKSIAACFRRLADPRHPSQGSTIRKRTKQLNPGVRLVGGRLEATEGWKWDEHLHR
jgi:hypothetical protein